MPITLVAHAITIGAPNGGTTSAIDTTGATLLVIAAGGYPGAGVRTIAVSDSKGNTWTPLTQQSSSAAAAVQIFYVANPTVGSGHTFAASNNSIYGGLCVAAFGGVTTTSPFDKENGKFATGSTAQPGSLTPTNNNSLIVLGYAFDTGTSIVVDSGFTQTDLQAYSSGMTDGFGMAYLVQGSAAAVNPTVTFSGALDYAIADAVFAPSAGPAYRRRRRPNQLLNAL